MFDTQKEFEVGIRSGGRKVCRLRFPTDAEWCERARAITTVRRFLGRGKSTSETTGAEAANERLFDKIRLDKDGDPFDQAEMAAAIERLERASVESITPRSSGYSVSLRVPGREGENITEHVLACPTLSQIDANEKASIRPVLGRRTNEIKVFLEPSGELYDRLIQCKPEEAGYAGAVPIIHKVAVVTELIQHVTEEDDENPEA